MTLHRYPPRNRRNGIRRRGLATLETLVVVGVTLPITVGLFFTARAACGRLFHVIEMLVTWPHL